MASVDRRKSGMLTVCSLAGVELSPSVDVQTLMEISDRSAVAVGDAQLVKNE